MRMALRYYILLILVFIHADRSNAEDAMEAYHRAVTVEYRDVMGAKEYTGAGENSLDEYLRYAALNNPALEAAFDRWKAEMEAIPQATTLPDPRLTYAYYLTSVETRVGPQRHKVDLTQMLPWFGTLRLRGEMSLANADIKWQDFQQREQELYYRVRTAYYDLFLLSRRVATVRENMVLLTLLEEVVRANYSTGSANQGELNKIQVELGRLEERLLSLEDTRPALAARLNAAMNRPLDTTIVIPDSLPVETLGLSEEELTERVLAHNPGLQSLNIIQEREQLSEELAGKAYWPTLTFGLSWIETGEARMPGVDDSGKDPFMPMISVNLPVWRGSYRAQVNGAALRKRAAEQELHEKRNLTSADLQMTLYTYRDAERKSSLYRDSLVPKARQVLSNILAAYESGGGDFLGVIDAQRTLIEFQLAYEEAVAAQASALAGIDLLAGGAEYTVEEDE